MATMFSRAHGLALLRAGFGLYFLVQAYEKTSKGWLTSGAPLARMLNQSLPRVTPWYGEFLRHTVIPHAGLFAQLVNIGEWAVGISLLGLFTPLGALVGIWLNANYMLLKGLPNTAGSVDRLFVLADVVFIVTAAGMVWGLDGLLWRALPRKARQRTPLRAGGASRDSGLRGRVHGH